MTVRIQSSAQQLGSATVPNPFFTRNYIIGNILSAALIVYRNSLK